MKTAIIASLALPALAEDAAAPDAAAAAAEEFSVPDTTGAAFVETFQTDPFETGRWTKSADTTYEGQAWTFGAPEGVEGKYKDDTVSSRLSFIVEGAPPAPAHSHLPSPLLFPLCLPSPVRALRGRSTRSLFSSHAVGARRRTYNAQTTTHTIQHTTLREIAANLSPRWRHHEYTSPHCRICLPRWVVYLSCVYLSAVSTFGLQRRGFLKPASPMFAKVFVTTHCDHSTHWLFFPTWVGPPSGEFNHGGIIFPAFCASNYTDSSFLAHHHHGTQALIYLPTDIELHVPHTSTISPPPALFFCPPLLPGRHCRKGGQAVRHLDQAGQPGHV
jgi:hypothetical protein